MGYNHVDPHQKDDMMTWWNSGDFYSLSDRDVPRVSVRMLEIQKQELKNLADRYGLRVSEIVRMVLVETVFHDAHLWLQPHARYGSYEYDQKMAKVNAIEAEWAKEQKKIEEEKWIQDTIISNDEDE